MKKTGLLVIPILLSMLSCGFLPGTGGNPEEGRPCNEKVMKVHAGSLALEMTVNCAYKKECNVKLHFRVTALPESLEGMCFGNGSEWRFESFDTSMTVTTELNKSYPVKLSQDDHLRFSLIDINNVEKKYDIDLSEIINSYTVRGDSVDVNVMKNCRITVISTPRNIEIYGNVYPESIFTFSAKESLRSWFGYDCSWHEQGPLEKDDLNIHAEIYWRM